MDILVTTDRNYAKYLRVLMASAYANHKHLIESGEGVTFWVLHDGLDQIEEQKLNSFAQEYNQTINCIRVDSEEFQKFLLPEHWNSGTAKRWPAASYFHLLAHKYLPEDIDRVLALDVDIVIDGDLTEFYNLDFEDNYLIVNHLVPDCANEPENEFERFDYGKDFVEINSTMNSGKLYFNAGVILYNLKKFREENIDWAFYASVVEKFKVGITDEKIANQCFAAKSKFLTTAKYNYRMSIAVKGYYSAQNIAKNTELKYNFTYLPAKIYHYGGMLTHCKPWDFYFDENELECAENEFFQMVPEIAKLFLVWWKYAKLSPDYNMFWENQLRNKAAYNLAKTLVFKQRESFINGLGIETLYVPSGWGYNDIKPNTDLNDYVKPKVLRCVDGKTKETIKNLPLEFKTKVGFRLTVKHIAANAGGNTAVLQILESNTDDAAIYRRYGHMNGKDWNKWHKMVCLDEVQNLVSKAMSDYDKKIKQCLSEIADNCKNSKKLKEAINNMGGVKINTSNIEKSISYRIGRAITWLPRMLLKPFRRKKKATSK